MAKVGSSFAQTVPVGFKDSLISAGWNEPTCFAWDSTGQMYVSEKAGLIWVIDTNGNKLATPLLDIHDEVGNWRDHGLGGFALDPNFRTNGYFYLYYTVDRHHIRFFGTPSYSPGNDEFFSATIARLTRYTANSATNFTTLVANSRLVLLGETKKTGVPVLFESHVGGQILFGRDNSLLLFTGDGSDFDIADSGSAPTTYFAQALTDSIIRPEENCGSYRSQLLNCLGGKILRLDPATGNGLASNPFFDSANPRSPVSRVYALGLRNPFRATMRPGTGSTDITAGNPGVMYIGDACNGATGKRYIPAMHRAKTLVGPFTKD
ncbi:MAG: PQQ-dependent sugar dehydrogenase [Bacteroidetes bacterium]|nr:PQQ-dependent sugar dehydrogenase [Bacteroidota bacterium]